MDVIDVEVGAAAWASLPGLQMPGDAAMAERVPACRHVRL